MLICWDYTFVARKLKLWGDMYYSWKWWIGTHVYKNDHNSAYGHHFLFTIVFYTERDIYVYSMVPQVTIFFLISRQGKPHPQWRHTYTHTELLRLAISHLQPEISLGARRYLLNKHSLCGKKSYDRIACVTRSNQMRERQLQERSWKLLFARNTHFSFVGSTHTRHIWRFQELTRHYGSEWQKSDDWRYRL